MEAVWAWVATGLIAVVVGFQIALAAGALWGEFAWGGQTTGTLPTRLRIGSAISAVILTAAASAVLSEAGVIGSSLLPSDWLTPATWIIAGYFLLGVPLNLASRSKRERWWAPVSLVTAAATALVAHL